MAYTGTLPAEPSRIASGRLAHPRLRFTHQDASLYRVQESGGSAKYPASLRMAILVGGSAMLWGAIGHFAGVI